jgi:putative spermidine/putrescine transport system ATP-binding protein
MSCRLSDEDGAVVEGFGSHFDLPREGRHAYQCGETLTPWVRPEDIRIGPATADEVGCVATVVETLFVGALERLVLRTGGGEQLVATPHSDAMIGAAPGQALSCRIKASAIGLLPNESRTS